MSNGTKTHKDLNAWTHAMSLAGKVYEATRQFPAAETYGLVSQMRRAAVSIPSNMAEGAARGTTNEFIRFLRIALGSLAELETQVLLAANFKYLSQTEDLLRDVEDIRRLTLGLIKHLGSRPQVREGDAVYGAHEVKSEE